MKTLMTKGRKPEARAASESKKKASIFSCVQQTAEWLEMYSRILQDLRQSPTTVR